MRVTVSTRHGKVSLDDLTTECSVEDVKRRVIEANNARRSEIASLSDHCLVFKGRRIANIQLPLTKHGVKDGARLVLLKTRASPPDVTHATEPAMPSPEDVERAIRAEADRQGREVAQPSSAPPRPREVPMEARLHDIMQALQSIGDDGPDMQQFVTQALRHAARMPRADALVEEVVVPEPSVAHMAQISDMGFSAAAARRALLLSRNVVSAAVNYLLAHGGDGDIEAEPTMDELRHVYNARTVRLAEPRQIEANPEHMELLISMGFTEAGARHALVRSDNSLEAAINLLTSMPAGWEPPLDAPAAASAAAADQEGAAQEQPVDVRPADSDEGAAHHGQTADVDGGAASGAGVAVAAERDNVSDHPSVPRMSDTGSEELSADEEQPLLSTDAGDASSAGLRTDAADTAGHSMRPSSAADHPAHIGGTNDAGEQAVTDALQAADADHLPMDTPTMMELQEGMRGLMTALGATTAGIANDVGTGAGGAGGGPMSGAMPILATGGGGDAAGMLDPMRLVDEMRWGGPFPAMLGDLLGPDVDEGGLAFDGYRSESTVYDDDDDQDDDSEDDVEEGGGGGIVHASEDDN
eukprot:jgi/Ulvmu1/1819/UM119_0037.1